MAAQSKLAHSSTFASSAIASLNDAGAHQFQPVGHPPNEGPIIVSDSEEELINRALERGDHMYRGKPQPCVISDENVFTVSRPVTRGSSRSIHIPASTGPSSKRSRSSTSVSYDNSQGSALPKKQRIRKVPDAVSSFMDTEAVVDGEVVSSDESDGEASDDDFIDDTPLGDDPVDLYVQHVAPATSIPVTPVAMADPSPPFHQPTVLQSPIGLGDNHMNVKAIHDALTNQNNPFLNGILRTVGQDPYLLTKLSAMFPSSPSPSNLPPSTPLHTGISVAYPPGITTPVSSTAGPYGSAPSTPSLSAAHSTANGVHPPSTPPVVAALPCTPLPSSHSPSHSNSSTPPVAQPAPKTRASSARAKAKGTSKAKPKANAKAKGKGKVKASNMEEPTVESTPVHPPSTASTHPPANSPSIQLLPHMLATPPQTPQTPITSASVSGPHPLLGSLSPAQLQLLQEMLATPPQTPQSGIGAPSIGPGHPQSPSPSTAVGAAAPAAPTTGRTTMRDLAALLPAGTVSDSADTPSSSSTITTVSKCQPLPPVCEVNNPKLHDPLLAGTYSDLPNLTMGRFTSWSSKVGRGQINFSTWITKCPDMDAESARSITTFVECGRFLNLSRCSPQVVSLREVHHNSVLRYNVYRGSNPAIAISSGYLWDSHLTLPKPYGLSQKMVSIVLHKQEWERLVACCCMIFNVKTMAAQVNMSALQFSTRADWNPEVAAQEEDNGPADADDHMFSHTASSAMDTSASGYSVESMSLSANATIPVYDARDTQLDVKNLHNITTLPRWTGEIPRGSFVSVGYTVAAYCPSQKWNLATNVQWAMVVGVPDREM